MAKQGHKAKANALLGRMGYASGGGIEARAPGGRTGGHGRGGKKGSTHVNVIVAPQGGAGAGVHPPMMPPPGGAVGAPRPPMAPAAGPPVVPGGAPPGLARPMPPPGVAPGMQRPFKRGGKVK